MEAAARVVVRPARPGDGAALARLHLENGAYYASLAPADFRIPDEEGLAEFVEPGPETTTETALALVAELDGELAGYLEARLLEPLGSARFQTPAAVGETRLFIDSVGTFRRFWRHGVASALVGAAERWGRERGAVLAECDTYLGSPVSLPFWEERMAYERRSVRLRKRL